MTPSTSSSGSSNSTSNMMMRKKRSSILGLFTLMTICLTPPVRAFTASLPLSSPSSSTRCSTYRSSRSSITAIAAADPSTAAFMIASSGIPEDNMSAVFAIVVLGVGFYAYNNGNSNEKSSSSSGGFGGKTRKKRAGGKYDISIPYDAAAYLSYENLLKKHRNKKATIGSEFDEFNRLYKERAVAEVTVKALQKKVHTTTEEIMELVESK